MSTPVEPWRNDLPFSIVLVGDVAVGITSMLRRYVDDTFSDWSCYKGVDFTWKSFELEGKRIKLTIWDVDGPLRYLDLIVPYLRGANGVILVYDITAKKSFDSITQWLCKVKKHASSDVQRLLIGNKCDWEPRRAVESERGEQLAWSQGIPFMETSAKTKHNINEAFELLLRLKLRKPKVCDDCKNGHLGEATSLLSNEECDINTLNSDDESLLHIACKNGHFNCVKTLAIFYRYIDFNEAKDTKDTKDTQNSFGDTPLHLACYGKLMHILKILLEIRCSSNIPNKKGETAQDISLNEDGDYLLHIACQWGDVNIVRYLITEEMCNPNVCSSVSKNTPLHIASKRKSLDIIKILLERKCSTKIPNKKGETAQYIPLNEDGDCLLHIACQWGDVNIVRYLITDEMYNPNVCSSTSKNTPLHIASKRKSLDIIKILLERKCNTNIPNKKGETAQYIPLNEDGDCLLHIACQWGDVNIVRYLISDERCNPNIQSSTSENTPLHITAKYGQEDTIVLLLSYKGCNPNAQNKDGDTPLHLAVRQNKIAAISQLLAHQQCNPNVKNSEGDTPLHTAAKYGQNDTVIQLLSCKKCDPNAQNKDGDTPLHFAVRQNKIAAISQLLAHQQCNPNVKNSEGDTPLHTTAKYWQDDTIIQLLSCKKCDPNAQNKDGDTPLHFAVRHNKIAAIFQLLADQQCNPNVKNSESDTPLHTAAKYGQDDTIIQLLSCKKCDPNAQNKDGDTPLHFAVRQNKIAAISQLLAHEQCNPNVKNSESDTPLHTAAKYGQNDTIIQLLSCKKCDPNAQNKDGDTPLHFAVRQNKIAAISQLLAHQQCNPNVKNSEGDTPLHTAAKYGQDDTIIQLLSCKKCDPNVQNKDGDTLLHFAVRHNKFAAISQLLAHQQCNPNAQNKEGDTPLHFAVIHNKLAAISQLLSHQQCNPNVTNREGDTPLHTAAKYGQNDYKEGDTPLHICCCRKSLDIIKVLLKKRCSTNIPNKKGETAQGIPLNEDGDCLLHIACQWGDMDIVRYLISDERCNPNVQSSTSENTPLHIAVKYGQDDTIVRLLSYKGCDPNAQNREGDTPLHFAVKQSKATAISKLLTHQQCNINVQNKEGSTPLHIACYRKSLNIIKVLLEGKCNTNIPNKKGETAQDIPLNEDGDCLLHIACQWGNVGTVRYLISDERCSPNVRSYTSGNTPLHVAAEHGQNDTIVQLLLYKECNPNTRNEDGDTPLHVMAKKVDKGKMCQLMITDDRCDVNILNNDHLTPLLIAIRLNNCTVATALQQKCDPTLCDSHGNTPLHLACIIGETQPEMVKVAKQLLTSTDVDPSHVNNLGQTPIELTTNYQLIQAISYFVKCKTKQSVQTYINIFIFGNPETGKSTLVKAICKEATSILWKIVPKQVRRVKNVALHTAGIVPTTFRSKTFGNTVLYDLAGQVEYYTSHAAVIQSTVISTPPAFIVVVDLSENEEKISQTVRYWWSFIDNHAARFSSLPQVILVGSHADIVKSTGESVKEKMTHISALCKSLPASFHFAGQVALDSRDPASRKLRNFCSLVYQSCTVLRETADVDLRCHVLYAFLLDTFKDKVACTVSDVATSVKENRELLPQNSASLIPLISTLSDKGLLLLVKGGESLADWWIILQKQALLGEMNGVIFAPKDFKQHKDLSWSTGVVPFSKLKKEFPEYNPNMITEFLIHLEFCFKIEDHQTLALLKDEATNVEDTSPDVSEEYYFFPALVSVENPLHVWEENDNMCCKCGWFYKCIRPDQFLTTQFLHVLILRLAFTFALKLDPGDCCEDSLALRRKCSVWKHGIAWLNRVPIETVVEVGLQYQTVIVMMRCHKGKEANCAELRSEVIQKILEAKDEHCKAVEMSESFINPTDVRYPFTNNIEDIKFYSLTEIARVTVTREEHFLDQRGRNPIPVQDLLLFDPCNTDTGPELLRELFSENHSMDKTVRSQVLETLNTNTTPPGTKPTLPELLKFTCTDGRVLNIPVEIATKHVSFGTFLLDDRNGSRVKIMACKHHYDAEQINIEILQEWLTEKGKQPVNWATLVEVLHDIELSTLADEIEEVKCPQDQSQVGQFHEATSHVTEK